MLHVHDALLQATFVSRNNDWIIILLHDLLVVTELSSAGNEGVLELVVEVTAKIRVRVILFEKRNDLSARHT